MHPTHPVSQLMYEVMHGDGDGHVNSPLRKSKHKKQQLPRPCRSPKPKEETLASSAFITRTEIHGPWESQARHRQWMDQASAVLVEPNQIIMLPPACQGGEAGIRQTPTDLPTDHLSRATTADLRLVGVCALRKDVNGSLRPWNSVAPSSYIQAFHKGPPAAT